MHLIEKSSGLSLAWPVMKIFCQPWIDEYRDRENRKLSIIVHNVPESVATESAAHIAHDTKYVTNIANIIDAGSIEILNITRLGKKLDDKPRLLKVQLSNLQQKRRILLYAKKLRETSGTFQSLCNSDLSLNERQENKHLRDNITMLVKKI